MPHPIIVFIAALITGNAAFAYAKSKSDHWTNPLFGVLAFFIPVSLPLITLYLVGKPLLPGATTKPVVIVLLTIGNIIAILGIIGLFVALSEQ